MPKRKNEDERILLYQQKIKKLKNQKKEASRRRRIIVYSDSESDIETNKELDTTESALDAEPPVETDEAMVPDLDPEIRRALGEAVEEAPDYGENIRDDISKVWTPLLRKGLPKEEKETILRTYNIPDNCRLLKAPTLNPEIAAAVPDAIRTRDKKLEIRQGQMALGITAIAKGLTTILNNGQKVDIVKHISEGCRILGDLHYVETQTRTKLITPSLDKNILNVIQDEERDDTLFGQKLSENIKAAKSIERQGQQIKRSVPVERKPLPQTSSRMRQLGNWNNPPRYPSSANRGGRGGSYTASRAVPGSNYRRFQPQTTPALAAPVRAGPQTRQQAARTRAPTRR